MTNKSWWRTLLGLGQHAVPVLIVFVIGSGVLAGIFRDRLRPMFPPFDLGFRSNPGAQLKEIFKELQPPYLCGSEEEESCNKDPINLLFINLRERPNTGDIAKAVRDELGRLDSQWGDRAIASSMYFSIDGARYVRQAELKDYQASVAPDAWHVRFRASPGCEMGSARDCYVVAAAHYDDFNPHICPGHGDVGLSFSNARELVSGAFAKNPEYSIVNNVSFENGDVPRQGQCRQARDREVNRIAVINMAQTTEISWPLESNAVATILASLPTVELPPNGSIVTATALTRFPAHLVENGSRRRVPDEIFTSCGFEPEQVMEIPLRQFLAMPAGPDLTTCP